MFSTLFANDEKIIEGEVVDLRERKRVSKQEAYDGVETIYYDILNHETKEKVGYTDLRLSIDGDNYYYGHVGYRIIERFRGHHYSFYACKLLFVIAREEFKMTELIITCSPENIASYKILTELDGEILELVEVPDNHELFLRGEKTKYIFKFVIKT